MGSDWGGEWDSHTAEHFSLLILDLTDVPGECGWRGWLVSASAALIVSPQGRVHSRGHLPSPLSPSSPPALYHHSPLPTPLSIPGIGMAWDQLIEGEGFPSWFS